MKDSCLWLALLVVVATAGTAGAEPYMAIREGFQCSGCHVNITGGGKRSDIVSTHPQEILHYPDYLSTFSSPADAFSGDVNKYVGVGADLRVSEQAIFQDAPDANGEVNNNTAFRGRLEENDLAATEAVGYLEVRLIPDLLTFYVDQRVSPNTNNREAFGLIRGLPWNGFLKAGRMFLPYGLQLQDDHAFIRGGNNGSATTGFSFEQQQAAFEMGIQPGPYSLIVALSDGAPGDRDVQVTGTASAMLTDLPVVRNALVGSSFSRVGPSGSETLLFGFFGGTNLERLTLLGEVDFRSDRSATTGGQTAGTFISYAEADYLLLGWLNIKAAFDYADDDGNQSTRVDDAENRVTLGVEPFLNRFLQPRLFYRVSNGVRDQPTHNQDLLMAELHFFF